MFRRILPLLMAALMTASILPASAEWLTQAEYPEFPEFPDDPFAEDYAARFDAWQAAVDGAASHQGHGAALAAFTLRSAPVFLADGEGKTNRIYSPINVYMALAAMAELTDGETRDQLLAVLDSPDMETLRETAGHVWLAQYRDDGMVTSRMGTSLWLSQALPVREDALKAFSGRFFASAYRGPMPDPQTDQAFRDWLSRQTSGLLDGMAGAPAFGPDTLAALCTTIYFKAGWANPFHAEETTDSVFHTESGDVLCRMMHKTVSASFWEGTSCTAAALSLSGGSVLFLLPREGLAPEALLEDPEAAQLIASAGTPQETPAVRVRFSVPRFDISSTLSLTDGLKALGVTDLFSDQADFSPLTDAPMRVSQALHAARTAMDEDGVVAAAFTMMMMSSGLYLDEPVPFTLDRPFVFVIAGSDHAPLFVGLVHQP